MALHPCRGPWHLRVSITHERKPERGHLRVGSTAADSYYSILLLTPLDAAAQRKWTHINYVVVDEVTPRLALDSLFLLHHLLEILHDECVRGKLWNRSTNCSRYHPATKLAARHNMATQHQRK